MESSWLERGMILAGWAIAGLLGVVAVMSVFHLRDGGGEDSSPPPPLAVARSTPANTRSSLVEGAARTPVPTSPRPTASPATTPERELQAPRTRCDRLRGSQNWQPSDREWFLANCLTGAASRPTSSYPPVNYEPPADDGVEALPPVSTSPPPSTPVVPEPTATPGPSGAAAAIGLAVQWLRTEAPVAYDADPAACSAVSLGGAWVATCNARLAGCGSQIACLRTIGLCVTLDPPSVTSARSC